MSQNIITASYNNAITVSFTNDAWFNATEVAKQFNKETKDWLRQRDNVEYVATLADMLSESKSGFLTQFKEISKLDGESAASRTKMLNLIKQTELVKTKGGSPENGGGSWFHPKLAIAFARWLDVKFSIWCDMQIEKILKGEPVQRDFINEPLKIALATKEQREPLVKAVRGLVMTAKSKGRNISFEEAHQMVNFSIGITSVEEMTVEMIPQAIKSVGNLLKTIVFEGEYIAKGEAEPIPDTPKTIKKPEKPLTYHEWIDIVNQMEAASFRVVSKKKFIELREAITKVLAELG
ncbi:MAG: KilA-N domain-containing protein [Methylococcaceae bacterium]